MGLKPEAMGAQKTNGAACCSGVAADGAAGWSSLPRPGPRTTSSSRLDDYFKTETIEGVSKHAEAPTETPATVTIIGRDEIERYGFRTLADVLNFASLGTFAVDDRRYTWPAAAGCTSSRTSTPASW